MKVGCETKRSEAYALHILVVFFFCYFLSQFHFDILFFLHLFDFIQFKEIFWLGRCRLWGGVRQCRCIQCAECGTNGYFEKSMMIHAILEEAMPSWNEEEARKRINWLTERSGDKRPRFRMRLFISFLRYVSLSSVPLCWTSVCDWMRVIL